MHNYSFRDDYSEGCHPKILAALAETNLIQQTAYGHDEYSEQARELIRSFLGRKDAPIYFVAGGTLSNIIIIASALRPHEAVISAASGHIALWETGAIEAAGHKVITVASSDGKLTASDIKTVLENHAHAPHMPKPRLVYISNTTEAGTVYTKAELQSLSETCKSNGLLLMLDGARLGSALSADINDLSLKDIVQLTDIFWIGGTKAGLLFGEAIVIPNESLADDFEFHIKQRGALLAKGRGLGVQFRELFTNNLFFDVSRHANAMAEKLSKGITDAGYSLSSPTESNQVFPVFPNEVIEYLEESFAFYTFGKLDERHSIARMVTSWATDETHVDAFIETVKAWGA